MRGKNLIDGLGSFIKNSFLTGSDGVGDTVDDDVMLPGRFSGNDFESHVVPMANGTARIFVARRSLTSYFNEDAEYSPTIIAAPKESYQYTQRKHTIDTLAGESPADLFINAVRKPVRQITEDIEPVIITKEVVEPVVPNTVPIADAEPVVQIAELPVELITAITESEPVVSSSSETPVISVEEVAVEAMEIEESSVEHALSQLASITEIEKEEIPMVAEIGEPSADPALSQLASLVDIDEDVVPQAAEIAESSVDQDLSMLASLVDIDEEVASETVEESVSGSHLLLAPAVGMLALPPSSKSKC